MRVSVAMPVYNAAPWLKESLDSIIAQTYTDFELIAVDDKSTDQSLSMLHAVQDPRLRVIQLEHNMGHPGATQAAFEAAQGEYIIRCDADDINHPGRFARQVAYMDEHPQIGVSGCGLQLFGHSSEVRKSPPDDAACRARMIFGSPVPEGACIIRRSVLQENGIGYRADWPRAGGDWLLMIDLAAVTAMGNLNEDLLYYRRGEQNISGSDRPAEVRRHAFRLALQRFGLEGSPEQVDLHMATVQVQRHATPELVRKVHGWLQRLAEVERRTGQCPEEAFREEAAMRWRRFFFSVVHGEASALLAYLRLNRGIPRGLWPYLLKVRLGKILGKK